MGIKIASRTKSNRYNDQPETNSKFTSVLNLIFYPYSRILVSMLSCCLFPSYYFLLMWKNNINVLPIHIQIAMPCKAKIGIAREGTDQLCLVEIYALTRLFKTKTQDNPLYTNIIYHEHRTTIHGVLRGTID